MVLGATFCVSLLLYDQCNLSARFILTKISEFKFINEVMIQDQIFVNLYLVKINSCFNYILCSFNQAEIRSKCPRTVSLISDITLFKDIFIVHGQTE